MLCKCGVQEATIHITEIVNGKMHEVHLCPQCVQEYESGLKEDIESVDLATLAGLGLTSVGSGKQPTLKCPDCGSTVDDFKEAGRLGCPTCYRTFASFIIPLIKRVQHSTHHVGKKPKGYKKPPAKKKSNLSMLQARLRTAVEEEAFEDAAKLRDQIKKLQAKNKKSR